MISARRVQEYLTVERKFWRQQLKTDYVKGRLAAIVDFWQALDRMHKEARND